MKQVFSVRLGGVLGTVLVAPALAQGVPPPTVERVTITGNPLAKAEMAQASQVLTGDALTLRQASTLGETLEGLPGVAATGFGPNASRPTIRGLDGDRIRLLENAAAMVDASNLSFDHAVATDPLVIERIEVLRGPASMLYGGSATGGVVNTLDNRIPRTGLANVEGRAEMRTGGAARERSVAGLLEGGTAAGRTAAGSLNWHIDGFRRTSGDLRVPTFVPEADGVAGQATGRVANSAAASHGSALGASWTDAQGYLGVAVDDWYKGYGVVVEPDVTIQMKRQRVSLAGERQLAGFLNRITGHVSDTRYRHDELEGDGTVGTSFQSRGQAWRLEARHNPVGGVQGVWGLQSESLAFSALGEEAFVPSTHTRSTALFGLESWQAGGAQWDVGLRLEQVRIASEGDSADASELRFGAAQARRFTPRSLSIAGLWSLGQGWSLSANLAHTERAPAYYELFANGLHLATAAYERGDSNLRPESGLHTDLGLSWRADARTRLTLNVWQMRFARFISLEASGNTVTLPGESGATREVAEYVFRTVPARLWGGEFEARQVLWAPDGWQLDGRMSLDLTRGRNTASGQALPRMAPARIGLGLTAAAGPWQWMLDWRHAQAQVQVPDTDVPTPGSTRWNLAVQYSARWQGMDSLWFAKLDNLGDTLAYNAAAIRTVRRLSPLPGRSLSAGLRLNF